MIKEDLQKLANKEKSEILSRFFKTGKGQYGEGDIFLGITVPEQRKVAKKYKDLSFNEVKDLLESKIHEHRLVALLILVEQFKKEENKKKIVDFYFLISLLLH
jgi:heterodisulfide reductase subunit C